MKKNSIPKNERELLALQTKAAKNAIQKTLEGLSRDLIHLVDLKAWAKRYPLPTAGAAALTGFLLVNQLSRPRAKDSQKASSDLPPPESSLDFWPLIIQSGADVLKTVLVPLATGLAQAYSHPSEPSS